MKYLIIYAHPREDSFNHAVLEKITTTLTEQNHDFVVHDLYKNGFDPLLSAADFASYTKHEILPDIQKEHLAINDADKLIIIHPIWWAGMPAIMKGYIDRVLIAGFAYKYQKGGPVGLLNDKPLLVLNTTGTPDEKMNASCIKDIMLKTMDKGIYEFCGFKVKHHFFTAVPFVTNETRTQYLKDIKGYLAEI